MESYTVVVNVNIIYNTHFDTYIFYLSIYNELLHYLKFVPQVSYKFKELDLFTMLKNLMK